MSLEAALLRVVEAGKFLHAETCRSPNPYPCVGCPRPLTVARALDWLQVNPRDARGVRRVFHDDRCASGCGPDDSDHADRTQATTAAALRRFRAAS